MIVIVIRHITVTRKSSTRSQPRFHSSLTYCNQQIPTDSLLLFQRIRANADPYMEETRRRLPYCCFWFRCIEVETARELVWSGSLIDAFGSNCGSKTQMESFWSHNAAPDSSHFLVAIYFAVGFFFARLVLDRFIFAVRFFAPSLSLSLFFFGVASSGKILICCFFESWMCILCFF